jgi:Flp pilus assembly protein CpaB
LAVTAVASLLAGGVTATVVGRANEVVAEYGERRTVPVATRTLNPGTEIDAGDIEWRTLPTRLVAGAAVTDPQGRTVVATILEGEAIVAERVSPEGLRGPMALAPEGTRAIAIATDQHRPPVTIGDAVDVLSVSLDRPDRAQRVAASARVVAVEDEAVTVAVRRDELGETARAALDGTALIALAGSS